jgi:hypothetical protein
MPILQNALAPVKNQGLADLCRELSRRITRGTWELKQFPFGFLLVVYFDTGIGDHQLRELGGREDGKCALKWYERNHEVVGIGKDPRTAARPVLSDGRGLRLRALQVAVVEDRRMHLVFKNLDTGAIVWPDELLVTAHRSC